MTRFVLPHPELQITFFHRLQDLRSGVLLEALLGTVATADIATVNKELSSLVTKAALRRLAGWGLRGEVVFAVPCLLRRNPRLLGYYRLLLGFSQKQFYGGGLGFERLRQLEERGTISEAQGTELRDACAVLCKCAESLTLEVGKLTESNVNELTLLTLGPQLRGGALNRVGGEATRKVFDVIRGIVKAGIVSSTDKGFRVKNAAGRFVEIQFASDPDIRVQERLASDRLRNIVAIEIKGGSDRSNVHNRLGEAEKSHQKARKAGYVECWTIVMVPALDLDLAHRESPSTNRFYDLEQLLAPDSEDATDFCERLRSLIGVSD